MNLMNHLPQLTAVLAAVMLSFGATAQDFPIPYNPDHDANGLIGTPDLLSLLALFGEEFSAAVIAEDSTSAIVYMGDMAYPVCAQSCRNLPGMWEMPTIEDLGLVWDEVHQASSSSSTWLKPRPNRGESDDDVMDYFYSSGTTAEYLVSQVVSVERRCYCSIKEIRKVEYTYCLGGSGIGECANAKVAGGWQPLGGVHVTRDLVVSQAFWRWAE